MGRCHSGCSSSSITVKSAHFYTKRWYFVLHVARCVIISPFFLFSLSQSVWHHFLASLLPSPSLLFVVFCNAHMVAHHTIFFVCLFFDIPPPLLCPLSFSSFLSFLVSLSVMAYQDGFYGAADLYVSIPLSPLLPHRSPTFSSSCLWVFFFHVWNGTDQTHRDVYFWVFFVVF